MLPFKTMLQIDKSLKTPLYLQMTSQLIKQINYGNIQPGYKLPGSRKMAAMFDINRRTISLAYEELESQGWVDIRTNSGCYVSSDLPKLKAREISPFPNQKDPLVKPIVFDDQYSFLDHFVAPQIKGDYITIDAGYPDIRLAPLKALTRNMNAILSGKNSVRLMNYTTDFRGDRKFRSALVEHLAKTRSINVELDNIMITQGSLMAFFHIFHIILSVGDKVIVGVPGFHVANKIIKIAGGEIIEVSVDSDGIDVMKIEKLCHRHKDIKAVFIMPHHHNPTTVSLTAERRMKLLALSNEYNFAIVEDDYDYDFHYNSSPILPMASSDRYEHVIYAGSLSKTIAPGLRLGYIVGSRELIKHISRLSRYISCHGNIAMERAISILFNDGEIDRYFKKAIKIYHKRRDHFCEVLQQELGAYVSFDIPEGGMAVWVNFDSKIPLDILRRKAMEKNLITAKSVFCDSKGNSLNAIRMGFASLTEEESIKAIGILKSCI